MVAAEAAARAQAGCGRAGSTRHEPCEKEWAVERTSVFGLGYRSLPSAVKMNIARKRRAATLAMAGSVSMRVSMS